MAASWRTRLPYYYGWVVLASTFLSQALGSSPQASFSVFLVALVEEFGWGRAATAATFSIYVVVHGLAGIGCGALLDRFGPARVVPAGALLLSLGLVACSRVSDLWQYYATLGLVAAVGSSLVGIVPSAVLVSHWFSVRRGLALGIATAGVGMGTMAMVPLSQHLISILGWRDTYLVLGALALVGIGPQAALLLVGRPEELGLRPDGAGAEGVGRPHPGARARALVVVDRRWTSFPWTLGSASRTHRFWLLGAFYVLAVSTNQMLWVHQVAYLVDGGYDRMLAASVVGMAGFLTMPAKVIWGIAVDRLGREVSFTLGACCTLVGLVALVLTWRFPGLVLLFALLFAIGYSATPTVGGAASADIFLGRNFGSIFGAMGLAIGIGSAIGPWVAGYVFDSTGSYLVAFGVAAVCTASAAGCMWLAGPRRVRRVTRGPGGALGN